MKRKKVKVLIIDDEKAILEIIEDFLQDSGFETLSANNGKDGLRYIQQQVADIALLDLNMPGVSGLDILNEIKKNNYNIPIIVISGNGEMEYVIQALRLGAWDYLTKPIADMEVLEYTIQKCIFRAALIKENQLYKKNLEKMNSELKESIQQLKKTQKQMIQSEKMAALGGLVAGFAHEINTPLGVSLTAASHLQTITKDIYHNFKKKNYDKSDIKKYLEKSMQASIMILSNIKRTANLIISFKQVAVDQTVEEKRIFNLKSYLSNILMSLQPEIKKYTQLSFNIDCAENLEINSYPGSFSQIITNLVMNSLIHAFNKNDLGMINIKIIKKNNFFHLKYEDNGSGIAPSLTNRIFEPFFTTKRGQGGAGLGLYIIYNIIQEKLNGEINCKVLEKGTRFEIIFPANE